MRDTAAELLSRRRWNRRARARYRQFVGRGDLVFDVGANVGNRVGILRSIGARVVAIDPQPQCVEHLAERWRSDSNVVVLATALGARDGTMPLHLASESTISSMSDRWIASVRESGRFASYAWGETVDVDVTTLDELIKQHGTPVFVKIDVEGFEPEVLSGLSQALPALSFEYTAERPDDARACIERLCGLGDYLFAFSPEETFELGPWRDAAALVRELRGLSGRLPWGDVYARLR